MGRAGPAIDGTWAGGSEILTKGAEGALLLLASTLVAAYGARRDTGPGRAPRARGAATVRRVSVLETGTAHQAGRIRTRGGTSRNTATARGAPTTAMPTEMTWGKPTATTAAAKSTRTAMATTATTKSTRGTSLIIQRLTQRQTIAAPPLGGLTQTARRKLPQGLILLVMGGKCRTHLAGRDGLPNKTILRLYSLDARVPRGMLHVGTGLARTKQDRITVSRQGRDTSQNVNVSLQSVKQSRIRGFHIVLRFQITVLHNRRSQARREVPTFGRQRVVEGVSLLDQGHLGAPKEGVPGCLCNSGRRGNRLSARRRTRLGIHRGSILVRRRIHIMGEITITGGALDAFLRGHRALF